MRFRTLALRLLVPAGLVVLVGVLASLEYKWLGEVSAADLSRRRASLQQHAEEFADDFDRELVRLYLVLQNDSFDVERGHPAGFADHLNAWRETARDPKILKSVYLVDGDPPAFKIREYRDDRRAFVDTSWPAALAPFRDHMTGIFKDATGASVDQVVLVPREQVAASIPALVVNLSSIQTIQSLDPGAPSGAYSFRRSGGFLIGYLDQEELRSSMLPALAERYFPARDADAYRLAILDGTDHDHPVLVRGLTSGATLDPGKADARVSLFALRFDLVPQLFARSVFTKDLNVASAVMRDAAANRITPAPSAPRITTVPDAANPAAAAGMVLGATTATARGGGTVTATGRSGRGGGGAGGGLAMGRQTTQGVQIVVQSAGPATADFFRITRTPPAAWQLVLQHSAGSLDAAVTQARRRNLWLSFGILGVLGVGVGLIVLNAQRSERLAEQQMDFVATVSHELRTPLAVIRSAAENLSAGVVLDAAQARKYGTVIEAEGRRLTDMVEQVLEYAGMSSGRRPRLAAPVDAGEIARDALSSCEPLVPGDHFDVELTVAPNLPPVIADGNALRRAVQNLATNALKYGADGRWLGVSVTRGSTRGRDEILITVSDRGRGIDAADLPHIFEAFYRGRRAVDEQIHGNGLGLSLVKRIVEAHDGRVTVKSAPGEGTAMTIHLPAASGHPSQIDHRSSDIDSRVGMPNPAFGASDDR